MNERHPDETGPLAPARPLTGPADTSARASTAGSESQTTMAIPVVTGEPQPQVRVPPHGPQPRAPRPPEPAPAQAPARPPSGDDTTQQTYTPGPAAAASTGQGSGETPAPAPARTASRRTRTRKARLRLTRIDPWSVMKMAFALSIALAVVTVVAVAIVWSVLDAAGVWDSINASVGAVLSDDASSSFDINDYVGTSRVLGLTTIIAAANVVLLTAIATLGAFLYNLAAMLLGGLELTLAEDGR